jgi:hypothetical protein
MADDTKYKDIFSILAMDQTAQMFAIDRDFKLWTMYMQSWNWTDWVSFPLPGTSGGVSKIYGTPGVITSGGGGGSNYYFPRIWAIDLKNDLWSCASGSQSSGPPNIWSSWAEWVPPYPLTMAQ